MATESFYVFTENAFTERAIQEALVKFNMSSSPVKKQCAEGTLPMYAIPLAIKERLETDKNWSGHKFTLYHWVDGAIKKYEPKKSRNSSRNKAKRSIVKLSALMHKQR